MPHIPLFIHPSHISPPLLGISVLVCTVIAYTIAKMFGFQRKNEFPVEGRVSEPCASICVFTPADFSVQTVVITGGSDGMGRAVAGQLAGKGAHVVVVARTASKLEATVEELRV